MRVEMASETTRRAQELLWETDLHQAIRKSFPGLDLEAEEPFSCQLTARIYHHKSLLSWYSLNYRNEEGNHCDQLVAKTFLHRPCRARLTYESIQELWRNGFRPPSVFRVPQVYGYSAETGTLFMANAPGETWRDILLRGGRDMMDASQIGADWLLHLHEGSANCRRANGHAAVARVQRFVRELSPIFPADAARLGKLGAIIARKMRHAGKGKPSHGDFHSKHLYITPRFATGIDFDNLALREPEFDVGYCVGHALAVSWFNSGKFDLGLAASRIFLRRYLARGRIRWPRLNLHIARSIFQSAHYGVVMRNPRVGQIEPWLDLVEHCLYAAEGELGVPPALANTLQNDWENPKENG